MLVTKGKYHKAAVIIRNLIQADRSHLCSKVVVYKTHTQVNCCCLYNGQVIFTVAVVAKKNNLTATTTATTTTVLCPAQASDWFAP